MKVDFKNKVIVITGGSSGIGKALVKAFLRRGAYVATCGRDSQKLQTLEAGINNNNLLTCTIDISKQEDCKRFYHAVIQRFKKVDIIIHNAGISMKGLVEDTKPEVIRTVMETNFLGTVQCNYYFLPELIKTKGIVVGLSSIGGSIGLPGRAGYSASKFALQGWLEALRVEMMCKGVHVMYIQPNFVESAIRYNALNIEGKRMNTTFLDEKKIMSADDCATMIIQAITRKCYTKVMTIQGRFIIFLHRILPKLADAMLRKFYFKGDSLIK